jgi:hypothetical protein
MLSLLDDITNDPDKSVEIMALYRDALHSVLAVCLADDDPASRFYLLSYNMHYMTSGLSMEVYKRDLQASSEGREHERH